MFFDRYWEAAEAADTSGWSVRCVDETNPQGINILPVNRCGSRFCADLARQPACFQEFASQWGGRGYTSNNESRFRFRIRGLTRDGPQIPPRAEALVGMTAEEGTSDNRYAEAPHYAPLGCVECRRLKPALESRLLISSVTLT